MAAAYSAVHLIINVQAGSILSSCLLQKLVILVPSPNVGLKIYQIKNALALVNKTRLYIKDAVAKEALHGQSS